MASRKVIWALSYPTVNVIGSDSGTNMTIVCACDQDGQPRKACAWTWTLNTYSVHRYQHEQAEGSEDSVSICMLDGNS